jgi:hypothetical protein
MRKVLLLAQGFNLSNNLVIIFIRMILLLIGMFFASVISVGLLFSWSSFQIDGQSTIVVVITQVVGKAPISRLPDNLMCDVSS